jgi:hypothetical protein
MEPQREELRNHLVAVLEAARELPRDDREYLADVFLDELSSGYQLVPRSQQQRRDWAGEIESLGQALLQLAIRSRLALAAGFALLFVLPSGVWLAGHAFGHEHFRAPGFFFLLIFLFAMRFFAPWRGGRGRGRYGRRGPYTPRTGPTML